MLRGQPVSERHRREPQAGLGGQTQRQSGLQDTYVQDATTAEHPLGCLKLRPRVTSVVLPPALVAWIAPSHDDLGLGMRLALADGTLANVRKQWLDKHWRAVDPVALPKEAEVFPLGRDPGGGRDRLRVEAPAAPRQREQNPCLDPQNHQGHKILCKATPFGGGLLGGWGGGVEGVK